MEMDSTSRGGGRPFDRSSRDPAALKKPRLLAEETSFLRGSSNGGRPVVHRQPALGLGLGFRSMTERDRDSESGYQPQLLTQSQLQHQQQQQQYNELLSQYRTALAELTFNSKPIITNLTIIAGENLQAAKAIAAAICNNIIEVPSDQKLPSLYLLDSIVKNIGRDYIKYFATRLPEVFCKAYRQVDPAVHPGMRHLFGTWKGVFPLQSLRVIEKELGFQSAANGSSSSGLTAARSEPPQPSQRPGRSIHVNPKYLEARQRLQQSSTVKGPTSDTNLINSPEDTERQDRITTANISSVRSRADPRLKNVQQAQRDDGAPYSDFDYSSDTSFGKSSDVVAEQGFDNHPWYGAGNNTTETVSGQRNGFDVKHGFPNLSASRSANADAKLQPMMNNNVASKRGGEANTSWKNSEEEEFMWDDMNSRLPTIPGKSGSSSSKRDPRAHLMNEKLGFENRLQKPQGMQNIIGSRVDREASSDSLSTNQKDGGALFRQPVVQPLGARRNSLDHAEAVHSTSLNSPSKTPLQPLGFPPNAIMTTQQRHTLGAASPSGQAPTQQRPPSPSFPTYHATKISHSLAGQDPPPTPHQLAGAADGKPARSRVQKNTVPSTQPPQRPQIRNLPLHPKKHAPVHQETVSEPSQSPNIKSADADIPGPTTTTGNLLAAVSSLLGNKSVAGGGILQTNSQTETSSRPPLPSGPPPTQFTSSVPRVGSTSNPVSSLLSTLVAKGLIHASKGDSTTSDDPNPTTRSQSQSPKIDIPPSQTVVSSVVLTASSGNDESSSLTNSAVKSAKSTTVDIKSLIGFEFKPDVIRRSHPAVISDLIDDLPHQCHACGLRFKLRERFDRHVEWHTLKNPEFSTLNKGSRRWFRNSDDWLIMEKPEVQSSDQTALPVDDDLGAAVEIDGEQMVVADESRCVCVLCGDLFEDFYCREMDKWMFRRAVHLSIKDGEAGNVNGPIVHADCISENSLSDLDLSNSVKREESE